MNYIEFKKDTDLIVKIHHNGKLRVIKNKANVEKLLELCKKYGYGKINEDCYLQEYANEIIKEYEKFYHKKKSTIKIYNTVNNLMKLKKPSKKLGTTIILSTLIAIGTISLVELKPKLEKVTISVDDENNDENDNSIYEDNEEVAFPINIEKKVENNNIQLEEDKIQFEAGTITSKETEMEEEHQTESELETNNEEKAKELENMLEDTKSEFVFNCENEEPGKFENAKQYADIFEKYGQMYGIDSKLLMAIAAQESGGNHYDFLYNYPAVGIMQIERNAHINQEITAYNHLDGSEETYLITDDSLTNLESNIKVAAMLLQISLEANDYNIPLGIQTYNFGTGYIYQALRMCEDISGIPISEMKNNMEETEWRYYREFLNIGDPYYVEHVLRFLASDDEITVKNRKEQDITLKITNEAEKNKTY